ncbi:hypothetical protein PCK1_003186 [Pneumocystis canis]|nr:hypothetical protein PCK1_003186 [Pneumocystis canis]
MNIHEKKNDKQGDEQNNVTKRSLEEGIDTISSFYIWDIETMLLESLISENDFILSHSSFYSTSLFHLSLS